MICVYCLSFAPALLYLESSKNAGSNYQLLFFFIFVVQMGDALPIHLGQAVRPPHHRGVDQPKPHLGRLLGGVASNTLLGAALWWAIPPFQPWQAAVLALVASVLGFAAG